MIRSRTDRLLRLHSVSPLAVSLCFLGEQHVCAACQQNYLPIVLVIQVLFDEI